MKWVSAFMTIRPILWRSGNHFSFLTRLPFSSSLRTIFLDRFGKDASNHFVAVLSCLLQGNLGTASYHCSNVLSGELGERNQTILSSIQGPHLLRVGEASQGIASRLDKVELESHRRYFISACRPRCLCLSPEKVVLSHSGRSA